MKRTPEEKKNFAEWFKKKTKSFAVSIIEFCHDLPENPSSQVIKYQLIKSATSTAANYRAVCRARSDAEFYSKYCIVVEEAGESLFWLEIIREIDLNYEKEALGDLLNEANEILSIAARARSSSRKKK